MIENDSAGEFIIYEPNWRPWREIALLMLIIMEVSWVVPWFRSLTPATYSASALYSFIIFFAMMLLAHTTARFLNYMRIKVVIRQVIMILFLFISILIGLKLLLYSNDKLTFLELINRPVDSFADWKSLIPDEFIVAIAIIIGWWRGISLAQEHVGPHLVMNHFNIGIFMFFLYGFINTMVTGESPGALIYLFIFTSLLAMGSARMSILHTLRGGGEPTFNRSWFIGMSIAALIVVLITGASTSFLGEGTGFIGYLVTGIFYIFMLLTYLIFSPVILFILWVFGKLPFNLEILESIAETLRNIQSAMQQIILNISDLINQSGITKIISDWAPRIRTILIWVILLIAIIGVAVWVGIRLWKERERRVLRDDQESLLNPGDVWKLLRSALLDGFKDLWGNITNLNLFSIGRQHRAAERIRQIYIEMMEMCLQLDVPKHEAETPIEYMPKIQQLFPNMTHDIKVITFAYNRIRYGEFPEQIQDVNTVEDAWKRLSQEGQFLLDSRKSIKKSPGFASGDS